MNYIILICIFFWSHITKCADANNVDLKKTTKQKSMHHVPWEIKRKTWKFIGLAF